MVVLRANLSKVPSVSSLLTRLHHQAHKLVTSCGWPLSPDYELQYVKERASAPDCKLPYVKEQASAFTIGTVQLNMIQSSESIELV